jgi:hypothetical protein
MDELNKHGMMGRAAMCTGMDRKTARKYVAAGEMPSAAAKARHWRTREDPFVEHWSEIEAMLVAAPGLEAKTIFDALAGKYPGQYDDGQLRTLQRRIRRFRAKSGGEREIVLAQRHIPGEAFQLDFTYATELAVRVANEPFAHMLCVVTLPYSNWRWATVCSSESLAALRRGLQRAIVQLGRVPTWLQTDNSTAATHRVPVPAKAGDPGDADSVKTRRFNEEYLATARHYGLDVRTTEVGAKEQNGDVEASNGATKRSLEQALLLRGSREFDDREAWQTFVDDALRKANSRKAKALEVELATMREVRVEKLPEYVEQRVCVSEWSTVRVKQCSYSVPSRLMHHWVNVRLFEERIEVWFDGSLELTCERLRGKKQSCIDYRHIVWTLTRKPGGFARYVYREQMFPSVTFRKAYDAIQTTTPGVKGDTEYLRVLHLAATTLESEVETALELLLSERRAPGFDLVKELVAGTRIASVPEMSAFVVDLSAYDNLLAEVGT